MRSNRADNLEVSGPLTDSSVDRLSTTSIINDCSLPRFLQPEATLEALEARAMHSVHRPRAGPGHSQLALTRGQVGPGPTLTHQLQNVIPTYVLEY